MLKKKYDSPSFLAENHLELLKIVKLRPTYHLTIIHTKWNVPTQIQQNEENLIITAL